MLFDHALYWYQCVKQPFTVTIKPTNRFIPKVALDFIEKEWEKLIRNYPNQFFNGDILCLENATNSSLIGFFASFKEVYFQRALRSICYYKYLQPLGVNGFIITGKGLLIGRRSQSVSIYKGYYECPPSGSLDKNYCFNDSLDYCQQILQELKEETMILQSSVAATVPLLLVYDKIYHHLDICLRIELKEDRAISTATTYEYSELFFLPFSDIPTFFRVHYRQIVPTAHAIISYIFSLKNFR